MVTRKKRKPLRPLTLIDKMFGWLDRVQREDALKRQLDTAVSLWFHERNALAIHVIAMSAYQCLCDLAGKKLDVSTDVYDWLRHSSTNRDERIEFSPAENAKLLWNATMLFLEVFDWHSARMRTFDLYYLLNPPGLAARHKNPDIGIWVPKTLSRKDVANLRHLRRIEFFRKLSRAFLAENADKVPVEEPIDTRPDPTRLAPDFARKR